MILTLPVADVLREFYPNAVIDMLVQSRAAELIKDYPALNNVIPLEKITTGAVKSICRNGKYDLAIAVYPDFSLALGLKLGKVKLRLGTGYRWYSFLFNLKHYQHRKDALKHESMYNLDLLKAINIQQYKDLTPYLKVKDEYVHSAIDKVNLSNSGKKLDETDRYIVIHVPTLSSAKVWSDENFKTLLNLLISDKKEDYKIIFTGTESEKQQIFNVIKENSDNERIFTAFNLNLKELAAILSRTKLFLGNSTGPIHIAAAVGTYVAGLYSPVKVESALRWGPLTDKKIIFAPKMDDNSRDVMNDIKPVEIHNFIKNYMEGSKK